MESNLGYPKTENSTDLTHYFWNGPKFTFEKNFLGSFWRGTKDMMTLLPGLWGGGGMTGLAPLDPPVGVNQRYAIVSAVCDRLWRCQAI